MNSGDFWQNIKEDWNSVSPRVDVGALRRQMDRKRRRMLVFMIMDVVAALVATGVFLGVGLPPALSFYPALPWLVVGLVWVAVIAGGWLRLSNWRADDLDAAGLLRLGMRRARAGIAFVWFNLIGLPLLYAIFAPAFWNIWKTGDPAQRHRLLVNLVVNAVFYGLIIAWGFWYGRRQRRKMRRAQALLQQLQQAEGGNE